MDSRRHARGAGQKYVERVGASHHLMEERGNGYA